MNQVSGRQVLLAASIVGLAVIAGSLVLAQSLNRVTAQLDRTTERLDGIRVAVAESKDALSNLQIAAAAPAAAPRRGPDPNKRYAVNVKGSPILGPDTAAITIVEFSDFQ
jgi:protein-disulfide isomerase